MAKLNINNIERVEGKYHVTFLEGKNSYDEAKLDLRNAWFSLLFYSLLLLTFILVTSFNLYYIGFALVYLIIFVAMAVTFSIQKKKSLKQCVYAVQNSKTTDIVAKQVDARKASRVFVDSMSSTLDKYDAQEKFPRLTQKIIRKQRHKHIASIITDFEEEKKKA